MTTGLIKDTAKAWGLTFSDVYKLDYWVATKIPRHHQSLVFVNLLRRKRAGEKQVKLNGVS